MFVAAIGLSEAAAYAQVVVPVVIFTLPYSVLTTMFAWATADIAEHHSLRTGEAVAGMFYAARTFFQKLADLFDALARRFRVHLPVASFGRHAFAGNAQVLLGPVRLLQVLLDTA